MSGAHTPDFFAVTAAELARGYSSRCQTCGQLLLSDIEFIGFPPCSEGARPIPAAHAIHLDVVCSRCGYDGPAPLLSIAATDYFHEHWTVVCPMCSKGWVVPLPESDAP